MFYDWIRNMDFAYPAVFGLFILLPFMIWWYKKKYDSRQAAIKVSAAKAFTVSSVKSYFRHLPFALRLLALSALIIALARPQKRNDQQYTEGEGIDIILCIDVSGSMNTRDILPSRLEVAKEVAIEFIRNRPVDRIGLVIFSGESFTQSPLTTDKNTLISQVQGLHAGYLSSGTLIGEGLATSVDRLTQSAAKSKVVVLITDGKEESPATRIIDPLTALEIARAMKVRVYTIGMGAKAPSVSEINGQPAQRDPDADFIDEDLLRKIAEETGGRYFRARDKEGLKNTYAQIDQMEKSKVENIAYKRYEELYLPFALAALGFLFWEIVLRLTVFRKFP